MLLLDEVPVFCGDFRLSVVEDDFAYLVGERDSFALRGERLVSVARSIDGSRTVEEILSLHADRDTDVHVLTLLDQLVEERVVMGRFAAYRASESAFWQAVQGADYVPQSVGALRMDVATVGAQPSLQPLLRALRQQGVEASPGAAHMLLVADDYLDIAAVMSTRPRREARWLLVKPTGVAPWVGPLLGGDDGPCLECLCFWLQTNRPIEALSRRTEHRAEPLPKVSAATPASVEIASNLAALAAVRFLTSRSGTDVLRDQLVELDLTTFQTTSHTVVRRPQCPACGDPSWMSRSGEARVQLASTRKVACEDGGYRQIAPRETYRKYEHLISRVSGAVTHVQPMPERDTTERAVYTSAHRVTPWQPRPREQQLRRYCAGKGRTPEQARTSALCEALERYSAVHQGDEARIRGSVRSLGEARHSP